MAVEHILIIDDSIAIASLLANEVLPLGGYRATAALSGEEGLELTRATRPDLILCDLEMPGLSGLEVLRTLRDEGLDIPAIMMTAFGSEAIAARALRIGAKGYIIKPFTTEEILSAVERALLEPRLQEQLNSLQDLFREYRQALSALQAVGRASISESGLGPFLSRIVAAATDGSNARAGYIASFDNQSNQLQVRAVANLESWLQREYRPREGSPLSEALVQSRITESYEKGQYWLHIPLAKQNQVIGILALLHPPRQLAQHVSGLLEALAGFASLALDNHRLSVSTRQVSANGQHQQ